MLAPTDLDVSIGNTSGSIGGSVATNFNVSGDITVAGAINAFLNNGGATSSLGSRITGDATINVLGATGIDGLQRCLFRNCKRGCWRQHFRWNYRWQRAGERHW